MDWWSKNDSINQSVCYFSAFVIFIVCIYLCSVFFAQNYLKVCRLLCGKWSLLWFNCISYSAVSVRCFCIISDNICVSHIGIVIIHCDYNNCILIIIQACVGIEYDSFSLLVVQCLQTLQIGLLTNISFQPLMYRLQIQSWKPIFRLPTAQHIQKWNKFITFIKLGTSDKI